jgi:hypothetical protein
MHSFLRACQACTSFPAAALVHICWLAVLQQLYCALVAHSLFSVMFTCLCHSRLPCLLLLPAAAAQVSHDQYLIESTVDELWCCEGGQVSAAAAAPAASMIILVSQGRSSLFCNGMQAEASSPSSGYQLLS